MEHGEKEYRLLKSAYAFLNRQISLYEKTVERKVAEQNSPNTANSMAASYISKALRMLS